MFQLLRRGFALDLALFLLSAVVVGAAVAGGLAAAIDAAFGDAVGHLLGQAGQYDVIVHLREESADGSLPVLKELVRRRWPDAEIHVGVRVAGNANVFVGLPPSARRADVFESLPSLFSQVTGYNGHTWLVEPSLTVSGVRAGALEVLKPQLQALEGVRFAFRHGSNVTVVLEDASYAQAVGAAIQELLERYKVVEIHLPEEARAASSPGDLWKALPESRRQRWVDLTAVSDGSNDLQAMVEQIGGVLEFLASRVYASPEADLQPGDRIILRGSSPTIPEPGLFVEDVKAAGFVVVEISGFEQGRPVGRIVQGDASELVPMGSGRYAEMGYRWEPVAGQPEAEGAGTAGRVGASVGTVSVESPRYALQEALQQAGTVVEQVARVTLEVEQAAGVTVDTLSRWLQTALNVSNTQQQVNQVQSLLNGDSQGVDRQALISLLISLLVQSNGLGGLNPGAAPAQNGSPAGSPPAVSSSSPPAAAFGAPLAGAAGAAAAEGAGGASRVGAGGASPGGLASVQQQLERLKQQVEQLGTAALQDLTASTARAREALPELRDDVLSEKLVWLDSYRRRRPGWNRALELLVPADENLEALERQVEAVAGVSPLITTFEAGLLNPNPRALLFQVLGQVRQTLAGVIAVGLVALILWADGSTLLHGAEQLARLPHRRMADDRLVDDFPAAEPSDGLHTRARRRRGWRSAARRCRGDGVARWPSVLWGSLWGSALLAGIFFLSGARVPGLMWYHVVTAGAFMGAVTGWWARRLAPINTDEVVAGVALGLSPDVVMREIIIPEGRPGFLMMINRWRMRMK